MNVETAPINGIRVIQPRVFDDDRGFFFESFNHEVMRDAGIDTQFVQDNHSFSRKCGTIRGLHFQSSPREQAKLVRVVRGSILDVAVDLRAGSPSFGEHFAIELSAENKKQLLIPAGFAHGFCTLSDNSEVLYKASDTYAPEFDCGIRWDDPDLAIPWAIAGGDVTLSTKDSNLPTLRQCFRL
ncbi:MAG: dTDP-4-dehydrorhamnose 3,5-epimerase [Gammaproteobacteria bacterium]|jgi:dTDP-4-dehydrorhamnose 3,5-epimerase